MVTKNKLKHDLRKKMRRALKSVMALDHSVSLPSFGSLFGYDPSKPLGQEQSRVANYFGVPFSYPSTNGTTPLNVLALLWQFQDLNQSMVMIN